VCQPGIQSSAAVTEWSEEDSSIYRDIADVAVPFRAEMIAALLAAVPFDRDAAVRFVELGSGEGQLAASLLEAYPRATLTALDGSESMRARATGRLRLFGERARVREFDVRSLDWWDAMIGADVVLSSLCLHHLNDAKKQYLYKAIAERISARGACLIADLVEPSAASVRAVFADEWDAAARLQADTLARADLFSRFVDAKWNHFRFPDPLDQPAPLFHHLVWLRHAGFAAVECMWLRAGHAVFGGFKQAAA
jgi:tRNA (cmo5U34)-methyltransferase